MALSKSTIGYMRPRDALESFGKLPSNPLGLMLDSLIDACLTIERPPRYIQSQKVPDRFKPSAGHRRYSPPPQNHTQNLGPVEHLLFAYFNDRRENPLALIGGMGTGKSTTISYMTSNHLRGNQVALFCDMNPFSNSGKNDSPDEVLHRIADQIATEIYKKIIKDDDQEFINAWSWGLSPNTNHKDHPSTSILHYCVRPSRLPTNPTPSDLEQAKKERKKLATRLCTQDATTRLRYFFFLIDHYITTIHNGDPRSVIIVIDNLDPFPLDIQKKVLRSSLDFSRQGHCKIIVPLRPLSYRSSLRDYVQTAQSAIYVIEQAGPSVSDLVRSRILDITTLDDEQLRAKITKDCPNITLPLHPSEEGEELIIDAQEIRIWLNTIMECIIDNTHHKPYIDQASGYSLRAGLLLAAKPFRSNLLSLRDATQGRLNSRQASRQVFRSMLINNFPCYVSDRTRILDNIFDSGANTEIHCLTAKIRILKLLQKQGQNGAKISEILEHMQAFGASTETTTAAINSLIHQVRRLAWSDIAVTFDTLTGFEHTIITITPAGEFYLEHAMTDLDYVQMVHMDCLLPKERTVQDPTSNIETRLRSVLEFLNHLCDIDNEEMTNFTRSKTPPSHYTNTWDDDLLSLKIVDKITESVTRLLSNELDHGTTYRRESLKNLLELWEQFPTSKRNQLRQHMKWLQDTKARN